MSTQIDLGSMFQAQPPKGGKGPRRVPSTAFTVRIVVHTLPADASNELKMAFAMYMYLIGTSKSTAIEEWKKYIATYSAFVVPSVGSRLPAEVYSVTTLSQDKATTMVEAYQGFMGYLNDHDEVPPEQTKTALLLGLRIDGYPTPDITLPWEELYTQLHPKLIVSHYSIVLFLMSKRVDSDNHSPITEARPKALRGKAHIDDVMPVLDGKLRLSDNSHLAINSAWAESAALRGVCVQEYALYGEIETDITQDLIYTSMHLMRFGNMSHAKITYAFLRAYPWAGEVPALKNAISVYKDSVKAASKHPEFLRPYLKLIYGDKLNIFPRNELDILIACAVEIEKETSPTLADFYVNDQYGPIVQAFMEERDKRGEIRRRIVDNQLLDLERAVDEEEGPEAGLTPQEGADAGPTID